MTSTFSWLAFSEKERRRVLDVVDLFGDRDTRDELGLGTVRDAFADLFFPGISTIQTRAKYFLFVPWVYMDLERKRKPSREIAGLARAAEVRLINILAETEGEAKGVIGFNARETLKRLPSNIYWQGLGLWRIRLFPGGQDAYQRSLDRFYELLRPRRLSSEEQQASASSRIANWHLGLPAAPDDFPKGATFKLSIDEASYLRDRILTSVPDSLLAFLVNESDDWDPSTIEYPWAHPAIERAGPVHRSRLRDAENFALAMYGAALLYNLILAELAANTDAREAYEVMLHEWTLEIEGARSALASWDRPGFWRLVRTVNPRIGLPTQGFVERWLALVLNLKAGGEIAGSEPARRLIIEREVALKRDQARVKNPRALELWGGNAGAYRLNFRWGKAQQILLDILHGLNGS